MELKTERNAVRIEKSSFREAELKYPAYSCLTCRNRKSNPIVEAGEVAAVVVIVLTIWFEKREKQWFVPCWFSRNSVKEAGSVPKPV